MRLSGKPFRELMQLFNDSDFEMKALGIHVRGRGVIGILIPSVIVIVIIIVTL